MPIMLNAVFDQIRPSKNGSGNMWEMKKSSKIFKNHRKMHKNHKKMKIFTKNQENCKKT
jgi:hypothetical protein